MGTHTPRLFPGSPLPAAWPAVSSPDRGWDGAMSHWSGAQSFWQQHKVFPAGHSWLPVCQGGSYITQRDDQPDLPLQIYQPEKAQEGRRDRHTEREREGALKYSSL